MSIQSQHPVPAFTSYPLIFLSLRSISSFTMHNSSILLSHSFRLFISALCRPINQPSSLVFAYYLPGVVLPSSLPTFFLLPSPPNSLKKGPDRKCHLCMSTCLILWATPALCVFNNILHLFEAISWFGFICFLRLQNCTCSQLTLWEKRFLLNLFLYSVPLVLKSMCLGSSFQISLCMFYEIPFQYFEPHVNISRTDQISLPISFLPSEELAWWTFYT